MADSPNSGSNPPLNSKSVRSNYDVYANPEAGPSSRPDISIVARDLKLSDSSSDEEVAMKSVVTRPDPNSNENLGVLTVENTSNSEMYDFSNIVNLQQQLITARERFDESFYDYNNQPVVDEVAGPSRQEPDSVYELLQVGESKKPTEYSESEDEKIEELRTVEITLAAPQDGKTKVTNKEAIKMRKTNVLRKERQRNLHQVHLLCLIGHGSYLNNVANNEYLLGIALSLLPSSNFYPPRPVTLSYYQKMVYWFYETISLQDMPSDNLDLLDRLEIQFHERRARSLKEYVIMFVSVMRSVGLSCRLVYSLRPVSLKVPSAEKEKEQDPEKIQAEVTPKKREPKGATRKKSSKKNPDPPKPKKARFIDFWVEVYLEYDQRWISAELGYPKVECVHHITSHCPRPIIYVLSWDNDGSIMDLTKRYNPNWFSAHKQRVDDHWWSETLTPFMGKKSKCEVDEDLCLDQEWQSRPLPASISEYKNHPLYALKRHLLKFEAIYPPDAVPLGTIRGEEVYSRFCVRELHSRETWRRKAKSVRIDEKPYKVVKARKRFDMERRPLELFGYWQVEDYMPPLAVNGKVPRNEYGNVELYQPSMLPRGTVHLQVPGMLRVARKLDIDCAPAVIGWQYTGGLSYPVIEGVVVCEEFQDVLMDAWNTEVDTAEKREKLRRAQRAFKNWRRVVRGVIIRERLKAKYKFGDVEHSPDVSPAKKKKKR